MPIDEAIGSLCHVEAWFSGTKGRNTRLLFRVPEVNRGQLVTQGYRNGTRIMEMFLNINGSSDYRKEWEKL